MKFATIFWCTLGFVSVANVGVNAVSKKDDKLTPQFWPPNWVQQSGELISNPECMAKFKAASNKLNNEITILTKEINENRKAIDDLVEQNKTSPVPNVDTKIERIEAAIAQDEIKKKVAESKKRSVDSRLKPNAMIADIHVAIAKGKEERKILAFEKNIADEKKHLSSLESKLTCITYDDIDSKAKRAQLAVDIEKAKYEIIRAEQRLEEFKRYQEIQALRKKLEAEGLLDSTQAFNKQGKIFHDLVQELIKKWESEGLSKDTINQHLGLIYLGENGNLKCSNSFFDEDIWGEFKDEFTCTNL